MERWDSKEKLISIKTKAKYVENGSELNPRDGKDKNAVKSKANVKINKELVQMNAYTINGQTYFQIRDLADKLGFKVKWVEKTKTVEISM